MPSYMWTVPNVGADESRGQRPEPVAAESDPVTLVPGQNEHRADGGFWRPTNYEVSKAVNKNGSVRNGDVLTYSIVIRNMGDTLGTQVVLTDPVPAGTTYVNAWSDPSVAVKEANGVVVWQVGNLAPGATFTGYIAVRVSGLTAGAIVKNVAVVGADGMPGQQQVLDSNEVNNPLEATAVTLSAFNATVAPEGVRIVWRTSLEQNSFGFYMWRSKTGKRDDAVKLNSDIIVAKGASVYGLVDAQGSLNDVYWLQEIEIDGTGHRIRAGNSAHARNDTRGWGRGASTCTRDGW